MFVVILGCLLASALSADVPKPRLTHLASGDVELSLEDAPGMKVYDVKYKIKGNTHQGPFHQGADGRWYHRNNDAGYDGKDKLKYTIVAEIDGKTVESKGKIHPEERSVASPPSKRVKRCTSVFRDDFNGAFNPNGWNYEVSMYGDYNWAVQAYVPDARNVFTRNGHLFIKPTLTTDHPMYTEATLSNGVMDLKQLYGYCTNSDRYGCLREGKYGLLPPVMSGKIKSKNTIRFGTVEFRARTPRGDWIRSAIWMLPKDSVYGGWPRSGEMDIMESRGNAVANDHNNMNRGVSEISSTLYWGPDAENNRVSHGNVYGDWSHGMHTYRLEWSSDRIFITVDGRTLLDVPIRQSFWQKGAFSGNNIWGGGSKAAPFDQPFYAILNVAIAGTSGFFPDDWHYNSPKPWNNNSPHEPQDFWNGRGNWLPSWRGDDVAMEIDYVDMQQC